MPLSFIQVTFSGTRTHRCAKGTGSEFMKLKIFGRSTLGVFLVAGVLLTLPFVAFADAQRSSHKKKKHKTAVMAPMQDAPTTDPIIVSRASDYQNQDPTVVPANDGAGSATIETERDR